MLHGERLEALTIPPRAGGPTSRPARGLGEPWALAREDLARRMLEYLVTTIPRQQMEAKMKNVLVLSYSLDGTTRQVARDIGRMLSANVDEIRDVRKRRGPLRYFQAGLESLAKGLPSIELDSKPSQYDLVVLGTPVWAGSMSSPMRSFLFMHGAELKAAACFCTTGGNGARGTLKEMRALCGTPGAPTLSLRKTDIVRGRHIDEVESFVHELRHLDTAFISPAA